MRKRLLGWGISRSVIYITVIVILISNLLNGLLMLVLVGEIVWVSVAIATAIPLIVGVTVGYSIMKMVFQLEAAHASLRLLSITDELTQSANRRYFIDCLTRELELAVRTGACFSVISFDLDDFKQVNDCYGHVAGDEVLKALSQLCRQQSRANDVFARYGGEEFAFLLPQTNAAAAQNFAERIRAGLECSKVDYNGNQIAVTASFGVFTWSPGITDLETILVKVDGAVYQAKARGKNNIVTAEK
jgi:diguanylate cyclase (GGDEF)-like protein